MTKVALIWLVYQTTGSAQAVGWLLLCYTGPVIIGGLLAGTLLDRFDRRMVMLLDNTVRGAVVASVPILSISGHLALWYIYLVALVYGFLMMITLAGGPALIPSLIPQDRLATANALESVSFTVSGVMGPPLAGLLIARFGAPSVLVIDALSYATFALALMSVHATAEPISEGQGDVKTYRLTDAISLLLKNAVLLSTTLMFMTFNIGEGFLSVWLPIYSTRVLGGGPELYGVLLGALAAGETVGSVLAGRLVLSLSLGTLICLSQVLSGVSLCLVLLGPNFWSATMGLTLLGFFSAPLTIWAQTLRMQIIPEQLRGRTFALLRTLMQSAGPLASAGAGALLSILAVPVMIGLSALLIGAPGVLGLGVKQLRQPEERHSKEKGETI
jgi:MFS family permease